MFRLFSNWNTYLTSEIREGKHLNKAQKNDYKYFFDKSTFVQLSQWTILWVDGDKVYWGKANQEKVDKYCFFVTSKKEIEDNFISLDAAKKKSLLDILNKYIQEHLGKIDGCKFSIENSSYDRIQIQADTNFNVIVDVELAVTPMSLKPVTRKESRKFDLVLHPHNFALIKIS